MPESDGLLYDKAPLSLPSFKLQQQPGTSRQYRWFGPARVIGIELRNPRKLEDDDVPTEGGAPHSYWLRHGPSVVLTTGEQMRFASEDELVAAHCFPHYAVANLQLRGAKSFIDARALEFRPQQGQQQDQQPSSPSRPASTSPSITQQSTLQHQQHSDQPLAPVPLEDELDRDIERQGQHQAVQVPHFPQVDKFLVFLPFQLLDIEDRQLWAEPEPQPMNVPTPRALQPAPGTPLQTAMQQPDRLDGHPGPIRTSSRSQV